MIPRHNGLVPAMRGPTASSTASSSTTTRTAAATATAAAATTTVHRYVIQPSPAPAATASSSPPQTTLTEERRLYTFLPSADMAAPPRELRVASYFFADADPSSVGASGDYEGSDNDDEDGEGDVLGGATPSSAGAASTGHKRRRRRRNREPMRLEYQGTMDPSPAQPPAAAAAAASGGVAKLASTPVPAYSHLACILLELPTGWREEQSSADAEDDTTTSSPLVPATVMVRPVLQLWGERRESGEVGAVRGSDAGSGGGGGISKSWLSSSSTRISKKDWKTMDAADADMHKRTNWSDDDNGGSGDETGETAQSLRDKKRAKAEATSSAVRSFLAGTKVALRQQRMGGEEDGEGEAPRELPRTQPMPPPAPPTKPTLKATLRQPATSTSSTAVAAAAAPRTLTVVAPPPAPAPVAAASSPPPPPPQEQQQQQQSAGSSATLPSLAAAVVSEVRRAEGRTSAPMMELQKRILKQLPDFAVMNQKMKVAETKKDAVEWFQSCQRELRVWLHAQGHAIASDGMVTFGG